MIMRVALRNSPTMLQMSEATGLECITLLTDGNRARMQASFLDGEERVSCFVRLAEVAAVWWEQGEVK